MDALLGSHPETDLWGAKQADWEAEVNIPDPLSSLRTQGPITTGIRCSDQYPPATAR